MENKKLKEYIEAKEALVQRRLGHASIQTTLDICSHVDQKALKTAFKEYQNRIGDKL